MQLLYCLPEEREEYPEMETNWKAYLRGPHWNLAKFCVIQGPQEELGLIFSTSNEHASMASLLLKSLDLDRSAFLYAGTMLPSKRQFAFGSITCCEQFGKDEPADPDTAKQKLLDALKHDKIIN